MRIGSARLSAIVASGSNDEYGSWNTTCMPRRSARILRSGSLVMSVPSNVTCRRWGRAAGAAPGRASTCPSPTRPPARPCVGRRPRGRRRRPRARVRPCGAGCRAGSGKCFTTHRAFEAASVDLRALQRELVDPDATRRGVARRPRGSSTGDARALGDRRTGSAGGTGTRSACAMGIGHHTGDRRQPLVVAPRPAGSPRAGLRCRGVGGARTGPRPTPPPRPGPRTSPRRASRGRRSTPRSWVTKITAMPSRACSDRSRSRICACTVTSSAVVGSSAMSSRGSHDSASASRARWRIPPDNWCG